MNLVDSSGWIEYFLDHRHASTFEKYILQTHSLLIPTLVLFEVFRQLCKKVDEKEALLAVTQMEKGQVISFDSNLALTAAQLSLQHKLGTADSIIYATALSHQAKLITLDNDFRGLPSCFVLN